MGARRPDVRMRDAYQRVDGSIPFVVGHAVPDMLYAAVFRSVMPHARITHIDVSEARHLPGVRCVITADDLVADSRIASTLYGDVRADQPVLASDKVRYVGDPVALVVAEDESLAREAVNHIDVDYKPLPYVVDAETAMRPDSPLVHEQYAGNDCGTWHLHRGDVDSAWAGCDRIYEDVYTSPSASHVPMEPHVAVARWEPDGVLRVWSSTQAPYAVKRALTSIFGLSADQVAVRALNLGGGYGAKGGTKIEPLTAVAARLAGAPVKLELTRVEVFQTVAKHAAKVDIKTGVRDDGTVVARDVSVIYDTGAYAITNPRAAAQGLVRATGPYSIPNVRVYATARYTNTVPAGPYRGAMTSQLCWAYESQMDDIAHDLGMDPVEIRRKNLLHDGDRHITGETLEDLHYDELLDDVSAYVHARKGRLASGPTRRRGVGLAIMIKSTLTPSRSEALMRLHRDGDVDLLTSSIEMGQGAHATMIAIAADALDLPPERITVPHPDTERSPFDTTTASSRTTYAMGTAVREAARHLRQQLSDLAVAHLRAAPDGLSHAKGSVWTGRESVEYEKLLADAGIEELVGRGVYQSPEGHGVLDEDGQGIASVHWHQGAVAVELEVDVETGRVEVVGMHGAAFAGHVIDHLRTKQQLEGSMIWGLGPTLFEELVYDDGQLVNPNLSDYMIPSILDVPIDISSTAFERSVPGGDPHGVGEMTVPPVSPAIGNAIFDAVGIRIKELPITPERVLEALVERGSA